MLLVYILLIGTIASGSLLIEDSVYDQNVHVEHNPFAGPIPADLTRESAQRYTVHFEEQRLENDLLASRGLKLDMHDELVTRCSVANVRTAGADTFRIVLRCHGDIVDVYRPIQPSGFDYTVVHRITPNSIKQVAIDGFPLEPRGTLKPKDAPGTNVLTLPEVPSVGTSLARQTVSPTSHRRT